MAAAWSCLWAAAAAAAAAGPPVLGAAGATLPNVMFVLADDWGWGDVGALASMVNSGDKPPVTPNLNKMVAEGTVYTRFHTLASVCSPSRASWMTGRYPLEVGSPYIYSCTHDANAKIGQSDFVPLNSSFLPRVLKSFGYRTAHYGKWHLGCTPDAPAVNSYGYDDSATYVSNMNNSAQLSNSTQPTFNDPWFPANSSRMIVDRALQFAAEDLSKPFYINLWFHISHAPLNPTPEQLKGFDVDHYCPWSGSYSEVNGQGFFTTCPIQIFRASQHEADTQIGRLLDTLRATYPNTLVMFSGDNGPEDPHIYFNAVGSAGAYRGRKRSLYEGGTSTPLIAWWPGHVPAGAVSHADIASIDFFPTILNIVGVPSTVPDPGVRSQLRGRDATRILLGGSSANETQPRRNPLAWEYIMAMPGKCYHQSPRLALLDPPMKLLMHPDRSRLELYNLSADYFESNDLSGQYPDLVDDMVKRLLSWRDSMPPVVESAVFLNPGCAVTRGRRLDVAAKFKAEIATLDPYELA